MKILMLFPYAPLPPPMDLGGTKRNLPFLLELAKRNDVSVLSFGTTEEERIFRTAYGTILDRICFIRRRPRALNGLVKAWLTITGRSIYRELLHRSMQRAIDTMTSEQTFDVIHCCVQMFGRYRFPPDIPISSDTHEVKHLLLERTARHARSPLTRLLHSLWARCSRNDEYWLCNRFNLLTTTTDVDYGIFRKRLPNLRMQAIPNGAGTPFFETLNIPPEPATMVFTGLFRHIPNSEGIHFFINDVFPLILKREPRAKVLVVGKDPPRELLARAAPNITVTGFVEDVRPYMARAQVFIIPLLAGGGIRGKALEAMAMKRPIVTTSIGVEGIHLTHDHSALFADDAAAFADQVMRLFGDEALRKRIAENAHAIVVKEYTWEANGMELHRALKQLVEDFATATARASRR